MCDAAATRVKDEGECMYRQCLYEQGRVQIGCVILHYNIYLKVKPQTKKQDLTVQG